jgi:hypothetical protein
VITGKKAYTADYILFNQEPETIVDTTDERVTT